MDSLHELIVQKACRDGWQRGNWRTAFIKKCKEDDMWAGDLDTEEGGKNIWGDIRRNPDAWRIVLEDKNTPGESWNYPVLIVEFLEVEIGHPMSAEKRQDYVGLWWRFDGTCCFHMRVYRAERYNGPVLWLDTDTIYSEMDIVG